ncbi:hypothetical protein J3459_014234 [Metarhizium acridum]|uniref:uncharacterized protein n=1 Tax=Metarhizium acridum TaxID=92637 RepID=UPI001C6B3EE7|nr:hypothetical protein J3459_014234 [Metarhizium acridum]KAG8416273.1 hypothetical protein J3458_006869 [Metarhizium acridum]
MDAMRPVSLGFIDGKDSWETARASADAALYRLAPRLVWAVWNPMLGAKRALVQGLLVLREQAASGRHGIRGRRSWSSIHRAPASHQLAVWLDSSPDRH